MEKRVRFEEPDEEEENKPRKLRFPKGKKHGNELEEINGSGRDGGARVDARMAARERAIRRNVMDEQLRSAEDTSDITDVTQAEEVKNVESDGGFKIEPFNLNEERRDGFFDDDGHYVEYATKFEARDAWLDTVEVDTRFAAQHLAETAQEVEPQLDEQEKGRIKKRIADTLERGETVLEALRRLRGSSKDGNKRGKLTGPAKIAFDQLTEDAAKLMDAGEIDVYDKVQEMFRREADAALKEDDHAIDIFGDDKPATSEWDSESQNATIRGEEPGKVVAESSSASFVQSAKASQELPTAVGIQRDEESERSTASGGDAVSSITTENQPSANYDASGYVFDGASGYYYNAEYGYYYDPNSGLFCSAESGKWFKFDEATNAYVEAT